jgi:hypothetical protein
MTKHGIAKGSGDSRAEPNSILRVVLIEAAVREYLKAQPGTLLSLERLCDAAESEDAESAEAKIGASRGTIFARGFVGWRSLVAPRV